MSKQMLIKPEAGQKTQCVVQHGHMYSLDFDTSTALFSRTDGDLLISFEDGASIILRDFYNESLMGDFFLELADGNVLSARSVVDSMEYMLDDFVTEGGPVYTAESYQPAKDGSSAHLIQVHGEEEIPLLAQPMYEAQNIGELSAEDSIAAHSGAFSPVTPHGGNAAVFDPALPQADYRMAEQGSGEEFSDSSREGETFFGGQSFGLGDASVLSAFVQTQDGDAPGTILITPRAHVDTELTPFTAHLGESGSRIGETGSDVFSPNSSREADLLLLEDLLDTTMPEELTAGNERVPAFEDLFAATHDDSLAVKIDPFVYSESDHLSTMTPSDPVGEGSEQLLLAFLRMGSF